MEQWPLTTLEVTKTNDKKGSEEYSLVSTITCDSASCAAYGDRWEKGKTKIYGRAKEVGEIRRAFDRVRASGRSEVILVHGKSGSGKTTLVNFALHQYVTTRYGRFGYGKFEQRPTKGQSNSALVAAFSEICEALMASCTDAERSLLAQELQNELGAEAKSLARIIPNLPSFLQIEITWEAEDQSQSILLDAALGQATVRLGQLAQIFLRVVASPQNEIVLFIDDIQWADENSMQIILFLLKEARFNHVLLILSFRDYNGEDNERVNQRLLEKTKEGDTNNPQLPRTEIYVGNLGIDSIVHLIADRHGTTCKDAIDDAKRAFAATKGNIYFVMEWLDRREKVGYAIWEAESCKDELFDLSLLLKERLLELPQEILKVLQLAALVGFEFGEDTLALLMVPNDRASEDDESGGSGSGEDPIDSSARLLSVGLKMAVERRFIRRINHQAYRFTHDRIQQCLFELMGNPKDRTALHLEVGRTFLSAVNSTETKETRTSQLLVMATDHMNRGSSLITKDDERFQLIDLNLLSGRLEKEKGDFSSALSYHREASSLLNTVQGGSAHLWDTRYELCLRVYDGLGYLEFCNGNGNQCSSACEVVLNNAKTLHDKLDAYSILIAVTGNHFGNLIEAILIGLSVLRQLGERISSRPGTLAIVRELLRARKALRGKSDEDLLSLPPMRDPTKLAAMTIMSKMSSVVSVGDQALEIFAVVMLRMVVLTCTFGVSEWASLTFAAYATIETSLNNMEVGRRYAQITMTIIERSSSKEAKLRALFLLHVLVRPWSNPYSESVVGLTQAYSLAMETSAFECAMIISCQRCSIMFITSVPLSRIELDNAILDRQLTDFKAVTMHKMLLPTWQCIQNLRGRSKDPLQLSGGVMNEHQYRASLIEGSDPMFAHCLRCVKIHLVCCFSGWFMLQELLHGFGKLRDKLTRGHFSMQDTTFFQGLMASILWHHTKRRRYRIEMLSCLRRLSRWVGDGVDNCRPLAKMLSAERAVMNWRGHSIGQITKSYDEAVRAAGALEVTYWKALFAKRAFEALHEVCKDTQSGLPFLRQAIETFDEWEAHGVVNFLHRRYGRWWSIYAENN